MDKKSMLDLAQDLGTMAKESIEKGNILVNNAGISEKIDEPNYDKITKGIDFYKNANESARTALQLAKYGSDKVYR